MYVFQEISLELPGVRFKQDNNSLDTLQMSLLLSGAQYISSVEYVEEGRRVIKAKLV